MDELRVIYGMMIHLGRTGTSRKLLPELDEGPLAPNSAIAVQGNKNNREKSKAIMVRTK
jgi:hypothetical protein